MVWLIIAAVFATAAVLTDRFCQTQSVFHILDMPNGRSLHHIPKPRTGGIAILCGIFLGIMLLQHKQLINIPLGSFIFAAVLVAAVSFLDDCFDVPPLARIVVHLGASCLVACTYVAVPYFGMPGEAFHWTPLIAIPAVTIAMAWMLNLYNFMDGMDGFVSGMSMMGLAAFAWTGYASGDTGYMAINLVVAAACAGFWIFNYPPSHIFMGDAGACTLGFVVAFLGLWGCEKHIFEPWFALLVFSPLVLDSTVTLLLRLVKGERFWVAQRNHFYHKVLLRTGHVKAVWLEYTLMAACGSSALWLWGMPASVQEIGLLIWIAVYALLIGSVWYFERRYSMLEKLS